MGIAFLCLFNYLVCVVCECIVPTQLFCPPFFSSLVLRRTCTAATLSFQERQPEGLPVIPMCAVQVRRFLYAFIAAIHGIVKRVLGSEYAVLPISLLCGFVRVSQLCTIYYVQLFVDCRKETFFLVLLQRNCSCYPVI